MAQADKIEQLQEQVGELRFQLLVESATINALTTILGQSGAINRDKLALAAMLPVSPDDDPIQRAVKLALAERLKLLHSLSEPLPQSFMERLLAALSRKP